MIEIILSIIVALCYGISAAIQKYSLDSMKGFSIRGLLRNKKWLLSLGIGGIGVLLYLFALKTVALSTIQPMLALSIIVPIIAGALFFNEKLRMHEAVAVILIIGGVAWISIV